MVKLGLIARTGLTVGRMIDNSYVQQTCRKTGVAVQASGHTIVVLLGMNCSVVKTSKLFCW